MASKLMVFSESDANLLKRFLEVARRHPVNTVNRGRDGAIDHEEMLPPEVYIAKVPVAGIPALTETSGNANDVPGVSECDIYRIVLESGVPRLRSTLTTRTVHNISLSAVVESVTPWITTKREKYGSWLADAASGVVGTGTDSEPLCGYLILDCPEDGVGTGSDVSGGYTSLCNDGEIVLDTIHLSVAYGADAVSVPLTTTDGHSWKYVGPPLDVGACGSDLQVTEVDLRCDPPWALTLVLNTPILQNFHNPIDFPDFTMVTSNPMYWTTQGYGAISTGCGFEVLELALTE